MKSRRTNQLIHLTKAKYILEMLKNGTLTLSQVKKWRDVYEAYLARIELVDPQGDTVPVVGSDGRSVLDQYYGMCWANVDYPSELLWTARCPDEHGACVVSSVRKLKDVAKSISLMKRSGVRFDKVKYLSKRTLDSRARTAEELLENIRTSNDFLFEKRREFQDEQEYRLILDLNDPVVLGRVAMCGGGERCEIKIEPLSFIEAVVLDPRMSESEFEIFRDAILKLKPTIQVYQSDIYQSVHRQFVFNAPKLDRKAENQFYREIKS